VSIALQGLDRGPRWRAILVCARGKAIHALGGGRRTRLGVKWFDVQIGEEAFEPGDRLLPYTDGVTEARDVSGEFFGLDRPVEPSGRVSAADVPPADVVRRLSHAVLAQRTCRLRTGGHHALPRATEASARTQRGGDVGGSGAHASMNLPRR
jgi:Stage II sporulation protein E (SpoIIE)